MYSCTGIIGLGGYVVAIKTNLIVVDVTQSAFIKTVRSIIWFIEAAFIGHVGIGD